MLIQFKYQNDENYETCIHVDNRKKMWNIELKQRMQFQADDDQFAVIRMSLSSNPYVDGP